MGARFYCKRAFFVRKIIVLRCFFVRCWLRVYRVRWIWRFAGLVVCHRRRGRALGLFLRTRRLRRLCQLWRVNGVRGCAALLLEPSQITRSIPKGRAMPALSAKNVLNVEKTTHPSIFGLPPPFLLPKEDKGAALASNFSLGLITTRLFG